MTWKVFITEASKIEPLSTPKASQSAPAVERNLDFSHAQYLTQFHAGKDCLPFEIILEIFCRASAKHALIVTTHVEIRRVCPNEH